MRDYSVDPDAIALLHALYRRARYSPAPVPAAVQEQARRTLVLVRAGLEMQRPVATAGTDSP